MTPPNEPTTSPSFEIRALDGHREYRLCLELQQDIWGRTFAESVPPSLLQLSHELGGVTAGAFDEDGRMAGFVFGISGVRKGLRAHWSHMLAVRPRHRSRGLGRRLKLFQRERLLAQDVRIMYWTFDPLEAKNAYLNIQRLGVRIDEYLEEVYPASASPVHRLGTDRLLARWDLDSDPAEQPAHTDEGRPDDPPVINRCDPQGRPAAVPAVRNVAEALRIEVPCRIGELKEGDPETGLQWRTSTRAAFRWALENRYRVVAFRRAEICSYLLERG